MNRKKMNEPLPGTLLSATVDAQGHLILPGDFMGGNVNERPLMEIWLSDEYARFRQKVEQFEFAPCTICASCEMAEANQEDCFGNAFPTCGGCLWAKGVIQCP